MSSGAGAAAVDTAGAGTAGEPRPVPVAGISLSAALGDPAGTAALGEATAGAATGLATAAGALVGTAVVGLAAAVGVGAAVGAQPESRRRLAMTRRELLAEFMYRYLVTSIELIVQMR